LGWVCLAKSSLVQIPQNQSEGSIRIMCGFAFEFSEKMDVKATQNLTFISHRGPDDINEVFLESQNCMVSFCRLAIRDILDGRQPQILNDFVSCFNGELYNQEEIECLIRNLEPDMSIPKGDMNILALYLYLTDGIGINRAIGMFSGFVYFRNKGIVKLFRDRTGEKPIFYQITNSSIRILSEYRFQNEKGEGFEPINLSYLEFFQGFWESKKSDEVLSCPIGSIVSVTLPTGDTRIENYWKWPKRIPARSPFNPINFEMLLEKVVESQLVSDVPVAVLLSSGVDSSLIASIASDKLQGRLTAFTLGFEDRGWDETNGAKRIARHLDIDHKIVLHSYEDLAQSIPGVLEAMDIPIFDPAAISMYALCRAVSSSHKVAIGGDGGDELFQGYELIAHEERIKKLRLSPLSRVIPRRLARHLMEMPSGPYNSQRMKLSRGISILQHPDLPLPVCALSPFAGTRLMDKMRPFIKVEHLAKSLNSAESYYQERILPFVYLVKSDRMSMAHSLELRSPFLDHRLIEASMSLPPAELGKSGQKRIIREIARKRLPEEVLQRRKHGFSPPFTKIIQYLPEPEWDDILIRDFGSDLKFTWEKARINQNYSIAAWAMLVCNYFIRERNLNLNFEKDS
jgi:asparagine synthase (glutamine-hydrolysing)